MEGFMHGSTSLICNLYVLMIHFEKWNVIIIQNTQIQGKTIFFIEKLQLSALFFWRPCVKPFYCRFVPWYATFVLRRNFVLQFHKKNLSPYFEFLFLLNGPHTAKHMKYFGFIKIYRNHSWFGRLRTWPIQWRGLRKRWTTWWRGLVLQSTKKVINIYFFYHIPNNKPKKFYW